MKSVTNLVYAVLLAFVIAVSANAGDQGTPGFANPSPSPTPDGIVATIKIGRASCRERV